MKFTHLPDAPVWNEDVSCYMVQDGESGNDIGVFYLDLYPRENKYSHACVDPLIFRAKIDGKIVHTASGMITNFDRPTPEKESLLYHDNVRTFFHEFGHAMHNICSEATY